MQADRLPLTAADQGALAVHPAGVVHGFVQALGDEAPLHGDVIGLLDGQGFVHAPADGAVVYGDVVRLLDAHRVAVVFVAAPHPDAADDHLVRLDGEGAVLQRNPLARRRLPGDGEVGIAHGEVGLELDGPSHVEHDCPGPLGLHCRAQGTRDVGAVL